MGTFSKSLAAIGGFIASSERVINYLKHHSRPFIFAASAAPASVAAVLAALDVMRDEPERIERLWDNARFMKQGLDALGFDTGASQTPVIPIVVGELERCFKVWRWLHDEGIFVNPVVPPAVPPGRTLVRISLTAGHTRDAARLGAGQVRRGGTQVRPDRRKHLAGDITVRAGRLRRERSSQYIRFPFELYRGFPHWVPPLLMERRDFLNPRKNPVYEYAEIQPFLARRGATVVGTITALKNRRFGEFHPARASRRLFRAVRVRNAMQTASRALFDAAASWLKARELSVMRGPTNFTTNDVLGLLVEGFDDDPDDSHALQSAVLRGAVRGVRPVARSRTCMRSRSGRTTTRDSSSSWRARCSRGAGSPSGR